MTGPTRSLSGRLVALVLIALSVVVATALAVLVTGSGRGELPAPAVAQQVGDWTRTNLQRPDGLLSWTWADGRVVDAESATAADIAHALVLAVERPQADQLLVQASGDPRWDELAFGLDAARVAIRYAAGCDEPDVRLEASLAPELVRKGADIRGVDDLGGGSTVDWQHPVALVAAAATADADGRRHQAADLMEAADEPDRRSPTYSGSAWNALGQLLLTGPPAAACAAG